MLLAPEATVVARGDQELGLVSEVSESATMSGQTSSIDTTLICRQYAYAYRYFYYHLLFYTGTLAQVAASLC